MPDNVTDETKFKMGSALLLRLNRNKSMTNYLNKGWKSNVQKSKLIYELKKHLRIKLSGVTLRQIEEMKPVVEKVGADVVAQTVVVENTIQVKDNIKGRRADHDSLPSEIQALFTENLNILRKERSLHEKLKLMDKALPCDRHEYVTMLIKLDNRRHENWHKYDSYVAATSGWDKKDPSPIQTVTETPAADASSISTCRSYISKALPRLAAMKDDELKVAAYASLLAEVQQKYEMATGLGAKFTEQYVKKLKDVGVKV